MEYGYEYELLFGGLFVGIIIFSLILLLIFYLISAFIFYNTAKTNGFEDIAYISWIPLVQYYVFFAFGSNNSNYEDIKKDALKWTIIYIVLFVLSFLPFIGFLTGIASVVIFFYFLYKLFYRWNGETGISVLFVILTLITGGIFFFIYGLFKMKQPFGQL